MVISWFAKGALPEEYLSHNFDEHCLEDTRLIWCLSYPSEGAPLIPGRYVSWYLKRLIVWIGSKARGYMPAHQHCDLFYQLVGGLIGSAIN